MKILISDHIDNDAVELLRKSGYIVDNKSGMDLSNLDKIISPYDVLICRTRTKLNADFFQQANQLKCVGLSSTGYDQIDLAAASLNEVAVLGLPAHNTLIDPLKNGNFISTAEHTILLILAVLGNFYGAASTLKSCRWEKHRYMGNEAFNKILGIIGFGRIAKLVAESSQALGMQILVYDPLLPKELIEKHGGKSVTLDELLKNSDIITIHTHNTEKTKNLLSEREFKLMKDGVLLINTARGAIVDQQALMDALNSGKVSRAAMDVFVNEPDEINWALVQHENVIPTPHIAGSTHEALKRISKDTARNIINFFEQKDYRNIINKEVLKS